MKNSKNQSLTIFDSAYFALSAAKHRHSITDMQETYSDAKKIKSLNVPDNGMGVGDLNALIKKQIRHINRKKKKERKMKEGKKSFDKLEFPRIKENPHVPVSINDWYKFINQLPLSEQILVAFALVFICSTSLFSFVFYIWFVMCFRKSFRYRHVCHQLNTG